MIKKNINNIIEECLDNIKYNIKYYDRVYEKVRLLRKFEVIISNLLTYSIYTKIYSSHLGISTFFHDFRYDIIYAEDLCLRKLQLFSYFIKELKMNG